MKRRTLLAGAATLPASFAIAQTDRSRTLRFLPQAALTILDPVATTGLVTTNNGWAIYDTLFGLNNAHEVRPQMADGYTVSDDGRTYLIKLREGLKFHDGEPVRAQDCAPSLKRWAARETIGQTLTKFVEEWGVQDDRTLKIVLNRKLPIFIESIARGGGTIPFMMPERIAKTDPFKPMSETIGSGPFLFARDEFVAGTAAVYRRNPHYIPRQEPAEWTSGGKVAHFERIEMKAVPEAATAAAALLNNEVDWYEQVQPDLVPLLRANKDIEIGNAIPQGWWGMMRFNHLHPPFDNQAVRKAVMMAVHQPDYMQAVTGNDPTGWRECRSFFPLGGPYGKELGIAAMPGDLAKARAALAASGYKGERVVVLNASDFPTMGPMGDVTYELLKQMGMNVDLVSTDWGSVQQRRNSKEPVEKGGWSISHTRVGAHLLSTPIEHYPLRGLGKTGWFGWYEDAEMERLTDAWLHAETPVAASAVCDAMQVRAFETVPSVPTGQFQIRSAWRKSLTGVIQATGVFFWNVRRV